MHGFAERKRIMTRLAIVLSAFSAIVFVALDTMAHSAGSYCRQLAIESLHNGFHADVELPDLQVAVFPRIRIYGKNLVLRQTSSRFPPLIEIREFSAQVRWIDLLGPHWKINRVNLSGLIIHVPPKQADKPRFQSLGKRLVPITVRELNADECQLEIIPSSSTALPQVFLIHHLVMHSMSRGGPAQYGAQLTN